MLRAGAATTTITPPLPVHLAGYGDRHGVATAVHDDLELRALVLDDADGRWCLCTLDLLGMTRDVSRPIREAVAEALDTAPEAVLTSCTHVHAGPSALAGTDAIGWPVPPGLTEMLVARARTVAAAARAALRPVSTSFARGDLPHDVAVNRRGHPLAPSAAVLVLRAAEPAGHDDVGSVVACVANFGIHPTVTGPSNVTIATDWVGPFRRALEARLGAGTALFLQGCQGDVNPSVTAWDDGDPGAWAPVVDRYAVRLADEVAAIARAAAPHPTSASVRVDVARHLGVAVGDTLLARLAGRADRDTRAIELLRAHVGDVTIVSVPGEGFHDVERVVRARLGDAVLLAGLAPDWHGYLPRPYTDGYEEGLSLGPDAVATIVDAIAS